MDSAAADIECGICYIYKLHHETHGDQNPDVVCTNDQCNRGFHPSCLYEVRWIYFLLKRVFLRGLVFSGYDRIQRLHVALMCFSAIAHTATR